MRLSTTCNGVPGLTEILGCPNIVVEDAESDSTEWDVRNHLDALDPIHVLIRQSAIGQGT